MKDEYGESWNDVLRFYRNHRHEVTLSDGGDGQADGELADNADKVAEQIAEALNGYEWHIDTSQVAAEVLDGLDESRSLAEIEKRTGRIEQALEEMQR